jgi:hypothetical protein
LDTEVVRRFGDEAIKAASQDPQLREVAWKGAELSLSHLTTEPGVHSLIEGRKWITGEEWLRGLPREYIHKNLEFKDVRQFFTEPLIPAASGRCWIALGIGIPDLSLSVKNCPEFTRYVGVNGYPNLPGLDGHKFRNVIFQHVSFAYGGGPIILENVAFIDCRFVLPVNEGTASLARSLMQTQRITFKKLG